MTDRVGILLIRYFLLFDFEATHPSRWPLIAEGLVLTFKPFCVTNEWIQVLLEFHEDLSEFTKKLEIQIQKTLGLSHLHNSDLDVLPTNRDMVQKRQKSCMLLIRWQFNRVKSQQTGLS